MTEQSRSDFQPTAPEFLERFMGQMSNRILDVCLERVAYFAHSRSFETPEIFRAIFEDRKRSLDSLRFTFKTQEQGQDSTCHYDGRFPGDVIVYLPDTISGHEKEAVEESAHEAVREATEAALRELTSLFDEQMISEEKELARVYQSARASSDVKELLGKHFWQDERLSQIEVIPSRRTALLYGLAEEVKTKSERNRSTADFAHYVPDNFKEDSIDMARVRTAVQEDIPAKLKEMGSRLSTQDQTKFFGQLQYLDTDMLVQNILKSLRSSITLFVKTLPHHGVTHGNNPFVEAVLHGDSITAKKFEGQMTGEWFINTYLLNQAIKELSDKLSYYVKKEEEWDWGAFDTRQP